MLNNYTNDVQSTNFACRWSTIFIEPAINIIDHVYKNSNHSAKNNAIISSNT